MNFEFQFGVLLKIYTVKLPSELYKNVTYLTVLGVNIWLLKLSSELMIIFILGLYILPAVKTE